MMINLIINFLFRERELQFYDTATYDPYCQITQLYSVPIHIDAKLTHNMSLIIVMGDMQGCVTVLMVEYAFFLFMTSFRATSATEK